MPHLILLRGAPGAGKTSVGTVFADRFAGWQFIELDQVKRERLGVEVYDPEAFSEAGRRARTALDSGRSLIAEEFFLQRPLIERFLEPTDLALDSPEVISFWLDCDLDAAVRRKERMTHPDVVVAAHELTVSRYIHPGEVVVDTTSLTADQVVSRMENALEGRGLRLAFEGRRC